MTPTLTPCDVARVVRLLAVVAVAALVFAALFIGGCRKNTLDVPPVNTERPAAAQAPKAADLSTPQNAVQSYLDWVTYAYRLARSDVASKAMGPAELARVDSYIELDRQRSRTVDQHLDSIRFGTPVTSGPSKQLLPARESWTYRYVDTLSGTFRGAAKKASFTATYTVEQSPSGWLVTSVEATSTTPVR